MVVRNHKKQKTYVIKPYAETRRRVHYPLFASDSVAVVPVHKLKHKVSTKKLNETHFRPVTSSRISVQPAGNLHCCDSGGGAALNRNISLSNLRAVGGM